MWCDKSANQAELMSVCLCVFVRKPLSLSTSPVFANILGMLLSSLVQSCSMLPRNSSFVRDVVDSVTWFFGCLQQSAVHYSAACRASVC